MTAESQRLGTVGIPPGTDQVVVSGTSGLRPDGTSPVDFADEVRQAWNNVREALLCAGAELSDIVQVRTWLTDAENVQIDVVAVVRSTAYRQDG